MVDAHTIRALLLRRSLTPEQWADMRKRAGATGLELSEMNEEQLRLMGALVQAWPTCGKGKG